MKLDFTEEPKISQLWQSSGHSNNPLLHLIRRCTHPVQSSDPAVTLRARVSRNIEEARKRAWNNPVVFLNGARSHSGVY